MRILHTMFRVFDLDRSIKFYTEVLGMRLLRKKDYESGEFTLAFLGYGDESKEHVLELTFNWDKRTYEHGSYFGHIAISTNDIYQTCEEIEKKGGTVSRKPGPMKGGSHPIAFVKDPDGYSIELIERD